MWGPVCERAAVPVTLTYNNNTSSGCDEHVTFWTVNGGISDHLWIIFVNCLFSWGSQGWSLSQLSQGERRVHLHRSQVRKDRNHTLSYTHLYVLGTTWQPSHWTVGEHMNVAERPQLTKTLEPGDFNLGSSAWHHLTAPTSGSNLVFVFYSRAAAVTPSPGGVLV